MTSTPDDLRNAMNDLARHTDPLDPGPVLHSGKRRRTRRRLTAAAGAAAALIAVTGGITALRPAGGTPATTGDSAALQALDDSLRGLQAGNYAFTRTGAYLLTDIARAEIDGADGYTVEYDTSMSLVQVGDATFLKPPGAGTYSNPAVLDQIRNAGTPQAEVDRYATAIAQLDGTRWLRVDQRRLTEAARVEEQSSLDHTAPAPTEDQPDITGATALIAAATTAQRTGNTITGTLDATRIDSQLSLIIDDPATYYGTAATTMSYRATLDEQGRLAGFTLDLPGAPASQAPDSRPEPPLVITVTRYDDVEAPRTPAGAEDITDLTYDLLARDTD